MYKNILSMANATRKTIKQSPTSCMAEIKPPWDHTEFNLNDKQKKN